MRTLLLVILASVSCSSYAQILDTLRIDTCLNIAFNKTQIDYYYLKKADRDLRLIRSTKILDVPIPAIVRDGFFGSGRLTKSDKTGKRKDGEKDTLTILYQDGTINYFLVRSFRSYPNSDRVYVEEKYVVPNGNNWFLDIIPTGKHLEQ